MWAKKRVLDNLVSSMFFFSRPIWSKYYPLLLGQKSLNREIFWSKITTKIENFIKKFMQNWNNHKTISPSVRHNYAPWNFFPIFFEFLTHQKSVFLLCGFCTPKGCSKFLTPFEQCTWFLKIMWKKTFWKLSFFCQSKNVGKKAWSEKFFDQKIQQNLRILWKKFMQNWNSHKTISPSVRHNYAP